MKAAAAIVPARAGSRGLPGKNEALLAGEPLWLRAARQGQDAAHRVLISTDIPALRSLAPPWLEYIDRPAALATDAAPMDGVLVHALRTAGVANGPVVLLQPTSPLRNAEDIAAALDLFAGGEHDLVMTVTQADPTVLKWGRLDAGRYRPLVSPEHCFQNRQALPPVWRPTGAVFVFEAGWLLSRGRLATERIGAVAMPPARALDIDDADDLALARVALDARDD